MIKKIFSILGIFMLALMTTGIANADSGPMTVIYGAVTTADITPVAGAEVEVTCIHNNESFVATDMTNTDGRYQASFMRNECAPMDVVEVVVNGDIDKMETGIVAYDSSCMINKVVVDVEMPEFGLIAAGIATIGAIAGIAIIRKR